jgi:hypothetical protein
MWSHMTTPTTGKPSVHVRLPADLIAHLRRQAKQQGASLNAYLAVLIAGASGFKLDDSKEKSDG